MSTWVPPYFGSYSELTNALLHDPFLGSGRTRGPVTHFEELRTPSPAQGLSPEPSPWRSPAVSYLGTLAGMLELSKNIKSEAAAKQLAAAAESAFAQFLDDYCGTPPHKIPWPWPVAGPWVIGLASELVAVANTYQAGGFRDSLLGMAGRIAEKGLGAPALAGAASAR